MNLDQLVVVYMNHIGTLTPWIDKAVVFFAEYFPYLVVVVFVVFVWMRGNHPFASPLPLGSPRDFPLEKGQWGRRLRLLTEGIGAALIARGAVEVIRFFVHRPRPFVDNTVFVSLLNETSYSFPSGHAAFFFALSTTVYLHNKRLGIWFFLASAVIGIARVMAGVHYPTDILGGAVLGVFVGWGVHRLFVRKSSGSSE